MILLRPFLTATIIGVICLSIQAAETPQPIFTPEEVAAQPLAESICGKVRGNPTPRASGSCDRPGPRPPGAAAAGVHRGVLPCCPAAPRSRWRHADSAAAGRCSNHRLYQVDLHADPGRTASSLSAGGGVAAGGLGYSTRAPSDQSALSSASPSLHGHIWPQTIKLQPRNLPTLLANAGPIRAVRLIR